MLYIADSTIQVILSDGTSLYLEKTSLPEVFLDWQIRSRLALFEHVKLKGGDTVKTMASHLPVMATHGSPPFQVNLAARGLGLLPKQALLPGFIERFEEAYQDLVDLPWEETLPKRAKIAGDFYSDKQHFNPFLLGGIEIFESNTQKNLKQNPLASLLYVGGAPDFISYQMNGVVEFLDGINPHSKFLMAARKLFAFDPFHVPQTHYGSAYLFHVIEVINKTPFSRK